MSQNPTQGSHFRGFFDAASGLPMTDTTKAGLTKAWDLAWADPSKRYPWAGQSRQLLNSSRAAVAVQLGLAPGQVAFLPGSADAAMGVAIQAAISKVAGHQERGERVRLLTSNVEELGVLRQVDALAASPPHGLVLERITVGVDQYGQVSPDDVLQSVGEGGAVVVVQAANGELGSHQHIGRLREVLPTSCILVVDARHQLGRTPLSLYGWLTIGRASTWGGPPDLAVLLSQDSRTLRGVANPTDGWLGVEQVNPPVPLIAAASLALESRLEQVSSDDARAFALTSQLQSRVLAELPEVSVLGNIHDRLGYITMFSFLYVAADELVDELGRRGWSVASGSACTSETERPLHVLQAIGALTHGNLRISLPPEATAEQIEDFADDLVETVARIRQAAGL